MNRPTGGAGSLPVTTTGKNRKAACWYSSLGGVTDEGKSVSGFTVVSDEARYRIRGGKAVPRMRSLAPFPEVAPRT